MDAPLRQVAPPPARSVRMALVRQLARGSCGAEALAERLGLNLANSSQHVQRSRGAGLVSSQRDGTCVVHRLADEAETEIVSLLPAARCVAALAVASMERVITAYLRARDALQPVAAQDPLVRRRQGDAVILGACPEDECGLGTCRAHGTFRSSVQRPSCRTNARSSRIAGVLTACCRSKPWPDCVRGF